MPTNWSSQAREDLKRWISYKDLHIHTQKHLPGVRDTERVDVKLDIDV